MVRMPVIWTSCSSSPGLFRCVTNTGDVSGGICAASSQAIRTGMKSGETCTRPTRKPTASGAPVTAALRSPWLRIPQILILGTRTVISQTAAHYTSKLCRRGCGATRYAVWARRRERPPTLPVLHWPRAFPAPTARIQQDSDGREMPEREIGFSTHPTCPRRSSVANPAEPVAGACCFTRCPMSRDQGLYSGRSPDPPRSRKPPGRK